MALVLDESHRIKGPDAKVTRAVHALRAEAPKRVIMTGTPVANKPEDIWSQLYFLDDGASLGSSFAEFRERYCAPSGGYLRVDELRQRIAEVSLRRQKEGTLSLPNKTIVRVPVRLSGVQLRMYNQMRDDLMVWVRDLSGTDVVAHGENILARLVRLAQLASNPGLLDAGYSELPAKYGTLDGLLPLHLTEQGTKAILWTSFVGHIPALVERYGLYHPVALYGEMDGSARDVAVEAFKTDPAVRLLVANPAAAREGLTLTEATTALYLDRTFSLVDFLQSQDRIHRLSQTRDCTIVLLVAENTIDEFIDFVLAQKHRLASYTQGDARTISLADLALRKPDVLRALLSPAG